MSPFTVIENFRTELDSLVSQTIDRASHTPSAEDEGWSDYLRAHGVTPKSGDERKQLLSLKEGELKGALPIEVRMILEKHKDTASARLVKLKEQFGQEEWWTRVETPANAIIHEVVDNGIKKYVAELKPKGVNARSIFANSMKTTPKYITEISKAGTKSEKCPTCMAARPAGFELTTCAFCGSPIFTT